MNETFFYSVIGIEDWVEKEPDRCIWDQGVLKERQIIAIPTPSTLNAIHCRLGFMLYGLK